MALNRLIIGALFGLTALAMLAGCSRKVDNITSRPVDSYQPIPQRRIYRIKRFPGPVIVTRTNENGEEEVVNEPGMYGPVITYVSAGKSTPAPEDTK